MPFAKSRYKRWTGVGRVRLENGGKKFKYNGVLYIYDVDWDIEKYELKASGCVSER